MVKTGLERYVYNFVPLTFKICALRKYLDINLYVQSVILVLPRLYHPCKNTNVLKIDINVMILNPVINK